MGEFWLDFTAIWLAARPLADRIFYALLIFAGGWVLIRLALRASLRILKARGVDEVMYTFVLTVARILLYVLLALTCMKTLGVDITPFITALGAVGLAVSLAIKDSLSNLAGGAFILVTKPFLKNDHVDIKGVEGKVEEIGLLHTTLHSFDNKRIMIPNGEISGAVIINYSSEGIRRVDAAFSIPYGVDYRAAEKAAGGALSRHPLVLGDPEPFARVTGYGASAVEITCRVWTANDGYWTVYYDLLAQVRAALDQGGFAAPFDQMDVHLNPLPAKESDR